MFLLNPHLHPRPGLKIIRTLVTEPTVVRVALHPEVHVALRFVGMPLVYQALNDLDDLRYFLGRPGIDVSSLNIESIHVHKVLGDELLGQLTGRNA